jgi:hypothetical protein
LLGTGSRAIAVTGSGSNRAVRIWSGPGTCTGCRAPIRNGGPTGIRDL